MERRREPRIASNQACEVTVLGADPACYDANVIDQSGRGMQLSLLHSLTPGSAVKVAIGDTLLLAEVCFSTPTSSGYIAGLEVDQILRGLTDLARLNFRLGFSCGPDCEYAEPQCTVR